MDLTLTTTSSRPSNEASLLWALAVRLITGVVVTSFLLPACDHAPPSSPTVPPVSPRVTAAVTSKVVAPTPKSPPAAAPTAPEPEVERPKPVLAASGAGDRRNRIISHYQTLRCLTARGAQSDELAAAFVASGLDPAQWDQALEELLREMADDPNGQAALAISAADARRCPSGGDR